MKNIIFVFADQLRYDSLGGNGNKHVQTPHIDRFMAEGISFDRAFANCPLCAPYRGQLLTGCYSHKNGVICNEYALKEEQDVFPRILKRHGYNTAYVGKWHLGYGPYKEEDRYGFDHLYAYNCDHDYYQTQYYHNEKGPFPMKTYAPERETDLAINYIKEQKDNNFALFLSWGPPHPSWGPHIKENKKERWYGIYPQKYDIYDPEKIQIGENVPSQFEAFERREKADYYGMVSSLDDQFGRMISFLKEEGLYEDTLICFTSDHGDHIGAHGYGQPGFSWLHPSMRASKGTPYEESIHVPFVLKDRSLKREDNRFSGFFGTVDIMPTLLGLCGISEGDCQGEDISSYLADDTTNPQDSVYLQNLATGWPNRSEWVGMWRGVRNERYTYARWKHPQNRKVLFDRETDKWEENNLAGNPLFAEVEKDMEARLQDWIEKTDDPFDKGERMEGLGILKLGQKLLDKNRFTENSPLGGLPPVLEEYLKES